MEAEGIEQAPEGNPAEHKQCTAQDEQPGGDLLCRHHKLSAWASNHIQYLPAEAQEEGRKNESSQEDADGCPHLRADERSRGGRDREDLS